MTAPTLTQDSPARAASAVARVLTLSFGAGAYVLFLGTFLYTIGFVWGLVPVSIDAGRAAPLTEALLVNGGFLGLFAVQHMVMARNAFKKRWTRIVSPAIERSIFVLATCLILIGLFVNWRAIPGVAWHVEGPVAAVLWALSGLGVAIVLYSTFLIDHFELFGLRQTVSAFLGRPLAGPPFVERSLYARVRHPLMLGFLIFFWATPHMSYGHLFFAVMCTGYICVGVWVEERTLIANVGQAYLDYRRRVPAILPLPRRTS